MEEKPNSQDQQGLPEVTARRVLHLLGRIWRRIENTVFGLVLTLIVLYFVLQSSLVQNWLIGKITGYLSSELNIVVRISHVDFSFFDNLILDGFYVEDQKGDTLLYANSLKAGLNSNIFTLLNQKLEVNEIGLSKARFNLRRAEGEYANNLQFILDYFVSEAKDEPKNPSTLRIRVQNLRLDDVQFLEDDKVNGRRMLAAIQSGTIRINSLDLGKSLLNVQSVQLDRPVFTIAEYPAKDLGEPERPAAKPIALKPDSNSLTGIPPELFRITVNSLSIKDGLFSIDKFDSSPARNTAPDVMDYNHMAIRRINLEADSVYADDDLLFEGRLNHLSAAEDCGFTVRHLEADHVLVSDKEAALYGMRLETDGSTLGDSISFHYNTYRDFLNFNNRIRMEGRFAPGSKIKLNDILYFSPAVAENSFFTRNREETIEITGKVDGKVNRLNGRGLQMRLNGNTFIEGDFDGDDMAEGSDRMRLSFDFHQARSDMFTIRKIIPGFNAPEYFNRLGKVNFKGTYQILFGTYHILAGKLDTDIGYGDVDMQLKLDGGLEKATYSGLLNMNDFNLQKWTNNSDFGKSTFQVKIVKGKGLTLKTLETELEGVVNSFNYRGYDYRNVKMNGNFDKSVFDGKLSIEDPNIDFTFDGKVTLKDTTDYDFKADLRRLDLGALNLVKEDWVLSGKINKIQLHAQSLNDLWGKIILSDFRLIQDKQFVHRIDSLWFAAFNLPNGDRYFGLFSDIINGSMEGRFAIDRMGSNLHKLFFQSYPELIEHAFGKPDDDSTAITDNYKVDIVLKNTRNLTHLIDPALDTIQGARLHGYVVANKKVSNLKVKIPSLTYDGIRVQDVDFAWNSAESEGTFDLDIPRVRLANGQQLGHIHLGGNAGRNQLGFSLRTQDAASIINQVNLNGELSAVDSLWQIKFNTSEIRLFDQEWLMDEDNYLRFSSQYFEARNFDLMHGLQRITIDGTEEGKGVDFSVANFDLDFFNRFVQLGDVRYRGKIFNLDVQINDLFQLKDLAASFTVDTLFLNDHPYGKLFGTFELPNLDSLLGWKVFLTDKDTVNSDTINSELRVLGAWAWARETEREYELDELGSVKSGEMQMKVSATQIPLEILQVFVPGISKTDGRINSDGILLGGPFDRIGMKGTAAVNGNFQLDYLKAMFYLKNQQVNLTDYQIWADGDTIYDGSQKNFALVQGGLRHDHFKDWRLECSIKSVGSNFMILNTSREDNALYYGQGIGQFDAKFTGSFNRTNIYINASTGSGTRFYIPLYSSTDIQDASFITFRDKNSTGSDPKNKTKSFILEELKGLNLEMNLSITEEADVQLIFDEKAGDIVKGRGEGDIRLTISREGEFRMYGSYQIRRGEYLFTLLNWVNKPFTVAQGGSINWYGDPYGAQLSLDATYEENTSLYNLLRDELTLTNNLSSEATKSTKVVVTMHLKGDLFKPNISFDLGFPNVTGQLRSLVDSKLTLLRQDQNELTRQVFGLIVVGSFLPPTGGAGNVQSGNYLTSAFNTLTQVLSNQFSGYLTSLATEWFGNTVSSINFDIDYNEYRNQTNPGQTDLAQIGRELRVRLTSGFINDRITVQVGSQFGLGQVGTTANNDGFLGEDVTIEIQLTENRQWRLKAYQRTEPDIAGGSRRSRYGIGISFRREYDSFSELLNGITGLFKSKKK